MKKRIKEFIALLVTMGICSSFAFTVQADAYDHIGFDSMQSAYAKDATQQLSITAYDAGGDTVAFSGDVTYSSSDENVVTVSGSGLMTMVNYGVATVTATYGNLTASMLITVTNRTITEGAIQEWNEGNYSVGHGRLGEGSYKPVGETIATSPTGAHDYQYECSNRSPLKSYAAYANSSNAAAIPANGVIEAWFYDNGNSTDSEVGIYMSAYSNDVRGSKAVGVLTASDTTYKVSGNALRMRHSGSVWITGGYVSLCQGDIDAATDTGIARTKGWHQVVFVRMNEDVATNPTLADGSNGNYTKPRSNVYDIYLDGQYVASDSSGYNNNNGTGRVFSFIYGYAGFNSTNTAYIADISAHQYIGVEDVALTESNSTFTINHTYYGTAGAQTNSYKWQVSDDGETGWTDIAGATSQSFTPSIATYGDKFIRGGIKIATSVETGYYFTGATYVFDGTYQHISLGKNTSYFTKGTSNNQLNLVGYAKDMTERSIADLTGAIFTSSNNSVVTVTNAGVLTAVDYGVATVTATYGNLTASMLITVTNRTITGGSIDNRAEGNYSEGHGRSGSYSYKPVGATITTSPTGEHDYQYECSNRSPLKSYAGYANYSNAGAIPANGVIEAWFYDNGNSTDSEVGIYMSAYSNDTRGSKAVGVLTASDTTYKVSRNVLRMRHSGSVWITGPYVSLCQGDIDAATDTGIARTKGWHQVVFVRMNEDVATNPTLADGSNGNYTKPRSNVYDIYLDGQHVATDSTGHDEVNGTGRVFSFIYGYAGFNSTNTAYIADISAHQYIGVEDVALTESNSTFTINHTYYGTADAQTNSYKWQVSDDGETGWTDIAGATSSTYTPTFNNRNKHIRGLVNVSTSAATTEYRNTDADVPNFSLISAVQNPTQINVSLKILNDTGESIPYALMIGYYNNSETEVIAFDSQISSVSSGTSKTSHTFTIPESARGNFSKAKIFLWEDMNNISPYTQEILLQ